MAETESSTKDVRLSETVYRSSPAVIVLRAAGIVLGVAGAAYTLFLVSDAQPDRAYADVNRAQVLQGVFYGLGSFVFAALWFAFASMVKHLGRATKRLDVLVDKQGSE